MAGTSRKAGGMSTGIAFMPPRFGAIGSGGGYDRGPRAAVSVDAGGGGGGEGGGPTMSGLWLPLAGRDTPGGGVAGRGTVAGAAGARAAVRTIAGTSR